MITSTIEKTIRAEYAAGKTQADLAAMLGTTDAYVNMLLSGKRAFGGLTLARIDRMFPRATVDLDGRSSIIASRVASPGDGDITYSPGDKSEALRSAIIAAMIDLDIPPECLAKVLKTIKNTRG